MRQCNKEANKRWKERKKEINASRGKQVWDEWYRRWIREP